MNCMSLLMVAELLYLRYDVGNQSRANFPFGCSHAFRSKQHFSYWH